MKFPYLVAIFLFRIILGCPPLCEIDPHNTTLCKMCGIGKIMVTYHNKPCIFYNKKHQDHGHNFTMQFTELRMDLEIFYQIILFITMKPNGVKKHAS